MAGGKADGQYQEGKRLVLCSVCMRKITLSLSEKKEAEPAICRIHEPSPSQCGGTVVVRWYVRQGTCKECIKPAACSQQLDINDHLECISLVFTLTKGPAWGNLLFRCSIYNLSQIRTQATAVNQRGHLTYWVGRSIR